MKQRTRRLRLAAFRPARLVAPDPAENVEMGKASSVADKALEEQRGDD